MMRQRTLDRAPLAVAILAALAALGCATLMDWALPGAIGTPEETFDMPRTHKLGEAALGVWNLHKAVMDAKAQGGWNNPEFPWPKDLQEGWRYTIANAAYAYPSVVIIEPDRIEEVANYLRQAILMMKETPVWDDWKRYGFGENAVIDKNIMYKGHLNLMYGLYQMMTGRREFEPEYKELAAIMVEEYARNSSGEHHCGIECEPDHYFPQCNSVGIMSLRVYDRIFGTGYDETHGRKVVDFIERKLSDPETGLVFRKYHPSHDQAEAYLTAFANAWGLTFLHVYDPPHFEKAFDHFGRLFVRDLIADKASFVVETANAEDMAVYGEPALGVLYVPVLAKEYGDPVLWGKIDRFLAIALEPRIQDGMMRFTSDEGRESEVIVQGYVLWGQVHVGWGKILSHPWEQAHARLGPEGR